MCLVFCRNLYRGCNWRQIMVLKFTVLFWLLIQDTITLIVPRTGVLPCHQSRCLFIFFEWKYCGCLWPCSECLIDNFFLIHHLVWYFCPRSQLHDVWIKDTMANKACDFIFSCSSLIYSNIFLSPFFLAEFPTFEHCCPISCGRAVPGRSLLGSLLPVPSLQQWFHTFGI